MIMSHLRREGLPRYLAEALLACALGLVFLVLVAWQQLQVMDELSEDWGALVERLRMRVGGTPFGAEVYRFVAVQVLLHAAFGLGCWLLAILTRKAFPSWRLGRIPLLLIWFGAATLWILVGNATVYPWSKSGFSSTLIATPLVENFRLFDLLSLVMLAAIGLVLFKAAFNTPWLRAQLPRLSLFGVLAVVVGLTLHYSSLVRDQGADVSGGKPNIILIGVDSLRCDALGNGRGIGLTPNMDAFIRDGAHRFHDAITPMGRTFPSWTSVLTGMYPRTTGARENLISFTELKEFDTLAELAKAAGYHTVYATDEVRFSNIDQSYGFEQVITPTIGAADFLLGKANDMPLPNMISNTWLGKFLVPATYGNRAASVTYRPETFVEWLDEEIQPTGPTLVAVHLALPHSPYHWAETNNEVFGRVSDRSYKYANAVIAADRQFGEILTMLERKGVLHNSIVVLLSDHGEALGIPESDTLLRGEIANQVMDGERISLYGHGTSVLSPHQFSALLAIRGYGDAEISQSGRDHTEPVSLVDITPTIVDLAGLRARAPFDGWSLRPLIEGEAEGEQRFIARPRFTETGFRTRLIMLGDFDEARVMGEAASFFVMNPATGRFEVRPELLDRLIADKERAVLSSNWLLASIPAGEQFETQKYVLVSRRGGLPRRLESAAHAQSDPEVWALWNALETHYGDELRPPEPRPAQAQALAHAR